MLAGGRLAHPGLLGQLTDGQFAVQHQPEDGPAGRVGERVARARTIGEIDAAFAAFAGAGDRG